MPFAAAERISLSCPKPCLIASLGRMLSCALLLGSLNAKAQTSSTGTIAEREVQRRQQQVQEAEAQLSEGVLLIQKGQSEAAARLLFKAHESLPDSPMAVAVQSQILAALSDAACAWAQELLAQGRRPDALRVLEAVLAPSVNPGDARAAKLRDQANDPERHPPALTPEHVAKVKQVQKLLILAGSAADLGDLDGATRSYQSVLGLDPYNIAARRGLEKVEQARSRYLEAARDQARAKALGDVSKLWEDQVPEATDITALLSSGGAGMATTNKRQQIDRKMRTLRLPKIQFAGAALDEVVEFMRLSTRNVDPDGTGISFVVNVDAETRSRSIALDLVDVPVEELVRYVTQLTSTAYRVEENAVVITSLSDKSTNLITRQYRVPPDFIQKGEVGVGAPADPFAPAAAPAGGLLVRRLGAKEFLESRGVTFPDGASANYSPSSSTLTVRNTADNLSFIDTLVEQAQGATPKQVHVAIKMFEINQKDYVENGFDVALGQSNAPGSERVFMSGGSTNPTISPLPLTTAGLRSSGAILGVPGIAELISQTGEPPSVGSVSPSQFHVSGVFTDPQFGLITRFLKQSKGTDLVTVPSVVTKSGQKASIRVVREFPYPTEFDPPQVPQQVGSVTVGNVITLTGSNAAPVTPTTPTNFETKELGVVLEVEPNVSEDGRTIDIAINPSITDFEGFIDYGSDITNAFDLQTFSLFAPTTTRSVPYVQDNDVLQPVFRKNSANTAVTIYDGSTIMLGGVMEERRVDIQDKVPVIGDIPLIGRLWQTKVSQTSKKHVIFFITVTVIDPSGHRINQVAVGP